MKNNIILTFLLFATGIATAMTQSSSGSPTSNGSPVKTMVIKEDFVDDTIELERPKVEPGPKEQALLEQQEERLQAHMAQWEDERKINLTKAVWHGQTETVKQLLEARPLPEYTGKPLLSIAIRYPTMVQLLLNAKAKPNRVDPRTGNTPLIEAVKRGYIDSARVLLKNNADPNKKDKQGRTALAWATKNYLAPETPPNNRALYGNIIDLLIPYGAK